MTPWLNSSGARSGGRVFLRLFLGPGAFTERIDEVAAEFRDNAVVMEIVSFIAADASRPICTVVAEADA